MHLPRFAILLAVSLALPVPIYAQTSGFADLAAIDAEIAGFTGNATGLPGGALQPVDRRLRLAPCTSALALSWHGIRRDAVQVQCPDAGGWHLYVPIRAAEAGGAAAIERGEAVNIAVTGDGFSVSQPGEAVEAGAVGDWIRVRVVSGGTARGEAMRARIIRPGAVEVPLP